MKKIFLLGGVLLIAGASCQKASFLDTKSTGSLNTEVTFADSTNTMDFLAGLYIDNAYNFNIASGHNLDDLSKEADEAEGRYPALGNFDKVFTSGTFANAYFGRFATNWTNFYNNIRNANIFLANVDKAPLSEAKKKRVKAEARFIRTLHYFFLTRSFGGVPLLGDRVYDLADAPTEKRATYEECVNYMISELDAIAPQLPPNYTGDDYGRITKGAALALKSRILLFAASPLYNGGSTAVDPELIKVTAYPTFDKNRWEKARLAAKAVMDLGIYTLNIDNSNAPTSQWSGSSTGKGYGFYNLFLTRVNNEFILPRPLPPGKQTEVVSNPKTRGGANFYFYPTQELVDMFPTINGKPISTDVKSPTNSSGYDEANPYANRDPRMSATIVYNQSMMFLNSTKALAPVNTYVGAPQDGIVAISSNTATITGYYNRKLTSEETAVTGGSNIQRSLPIIRYAEILLNYAEATNEMGNSAEAMQTLVPLRLRAGINAGTNGMYGLPVNPSVDDARKIIQNERAIELAFEQHRIWDMRRWKIGDLIDGKFLHGMRITKTGSKYTYERVEVRTRYFKPIYYYFPIPKDDVTISGGKLLQNPGYDGVPIKP
ncbi:MAG: hypothetical protein K0S09_702 [Sphingobacteriaceae bacterium]|nr:hypothetical protein [Sphingobacteriaceae bacterium]